ncbi:uncharacterized protein MELLADRAFT_104292 [Melampsora larici-populina 98AG31]|uniref:Uncharacterized protein n=1 Tax=Melampsora larici-populina (strain 98AG31 / pathotype 3-4-7) TaxID=747676 RepID=F4RE82_MELLP|nr:uncharacterized protein MELLADRAFT_104292 [Melampsora larici-populina 98AG31]EGG09048.1 hypothetical protein MELLADRAFT_104292 [Melampsora larici-populina 98AG31]
MAPSSTQSTLRFYSGYETDDNAPRRSGCITTPARLGPGMICPPSDSRQAVPSSSFTFSVSNQKNPTMTAQSKGKGKRARSESLPGSVIESEVDTDPPEIISGPAQRKTIPASRQKGSGGLTQARSKAASKTSKKSAASQRKDAEAEKNLVLAAEAGVAPNLNQDSDEENEQVCKRLRRSNEKDEDEFNPPVLFYGKPFRRENDCRFASKKFASEFYVARPALT